MQISVTTPVSHAIKTTQRVLFQPFNFGKWLGLGFCAFLAQFAGGGSMNFNFSYRGGNSPPMDHAFREAQQWIQETGASCSRL